MSRSLYYRHVPADPERGDLPYELIWLLEQAFSVSLSVEDPLELGREDVRALTLLRLDRPPPVAEAFQELIRAIGSSPSGKVQVWTYR